MYDSPVRLNSVETQPHIGVFWFAPIAWVYARDKTMNEHEKYLFDLRGYLVVKNALSSEQVADLSQRFEAHREVNEHPIFGSDRTQFRQDDDPAWSAASLLELGGTYIDLIDLPTIAPYLETLLGPNYRLDHDYTKVDNAERSRGLYLHGGGQGAGGPSDLVGPSDGGQCFYRFSNGRFFNGLIAVGFELNTVTQGDGGFACIPGSHKVNFELPSDWKISKTQEDVPECVNHVAAAAGDAIIFTEACAHGTIPWRGNRERRTIFYKYCPHAVAWSPCYYNSDNYPGLSDIQRAMLTPPSAYGPASTTESIWQRAQAEQTELKRLRKELAELKREQ